MRNQEYFTKTLRKRFDDEPNAADKINEAFVFDIEGEQWTVDLTNSRRLIAPGNTFEGISDSTVSRIEISQENFDMLIEAPIRTVMMFMLNMYTLPVEKVIEFYRMLIIGTDAP